jgi:phage baseplate assembly protein gpV
MHELWNSMKAAASSVDMTFGQNRWGTVTSVRASDQGYDIRVMLQPDNIPSAWIPVTTAYGGGGWGLVARPTIGMQVFLAPDLGDGQHYVALGMAYSTHAPPPKPTNGFNQSQGTAIADGEFAVVSKKGAVLRFCDDGTVYIKAPTVNIDGNLVVQGAITANTGDITARDKNVVAQTLNVIAQKGDVIDRHNSMDTVRSTYNRHVHGNSGGPNPTVPE